MKIELAKIPVKINEETVERDYVVINIDGKVLSLPLDPMYSTEEYKKTFGGFFSSISESVVDETNEITEEANG